MFKKKAKRGCLVSTLSPMLSRTGSTLTCSKMFDPTTMSMVRRKHAVNIPMGIRTQLVVNKKKARSGYLA